MILIIEVLLICQPGQDADEHYLKHHFRARGIEPRAHRNSEKKRQADALAAAAERGVISIAKTSNLLVQTHPASVHVAGALSREMFKESLLELSYQSSSVSKPAPPAPRGLSLAIAMAGSSDVLPASQIQSHATTTIESIQNPADINVVQFVRADDDSDDSGDDDF